jgi:Fic-DOC domain mobile mystery protein B
VGPQVTDDIPAGATPLTAEEQEELLPSIQTRGELNELEAANIDRATAWALGRGRRRAERDVITVDGLLALHRRMFGDTWRWAGRFRLSNKNLGVPKERIAEGLRNLCDDIRYQIDHRTYEPDELAVRFHHRLVSIHPFPNGNGRHARLAANVLVRRLGKEPFSWGGTSLVAPNPTRSQYIASLGKADAGDIGPLLVFARSRQ